MSIVKQFDTRGKIEYKLPDEKLRFLEGATVKFLLEKQDRTLLVEGDAVIDDPAQGILSYTLKEGDAISVGQHYGEFQVSFADGTFASYPKSGYLSVVINRSIDTGRETEFEERVAIKVSVIDEKFEELKEEVDTKFTGLETETAEWRESVAADVLEEVYPQVDVDRVSNKEVRAARKGEATLSAKMDKVDSQLAQTMTQNEFDGWVATLLDGGPSIFFDTYNQLVSAYPQGASGIALIRETDPSKIYVWVDGIWKLYGDYQGIEVGDKSISARKVEDEAISPEKLRNWYVGKNKFNKLAVTRGKILSSSNGIESDHSSHVVSEYIPSSPGLSYSRSGGNGTRIICFYDSRFNFISASTAPTAVSPANTYYIRTCTGIDQLGNYQLEIGTTNTAYEDYYFGVHQMQIEDVAKGIRDMEGNKIAPKSMNADRISDSRFTKNLFNKDRVTLNKSIDGNNGVIVNLEGFFVSEPMRVDVGKDYFISVKEGGLSLRRVAFYSEGMLFISSSTSQALKVPSNAVNMIVCAHVNNIPNLMVEQSAIQTVYEPYGYTLQYLQLPASGGGDQTSLTELRKFDLPKDSSLSVSSEYTSKDGVSHIQNAHLIPFVSENKINPLFGLDGKAQIINTTAITTNLKGGFSFKIGLYGSRFEFDVRGAVAGSVKILVNGEYLLGTYSLAPNSGETAGGRHFRLINLGKLGFHEITIECNSYVRLYGINTDPNAVIYPMIENKPKAIWFGDSVVEGGSSGHAQSLSAAATASRILGWECLNQGWGGTGFLNPGNGRTKFIDRLVTDVLNYQPDYFVFNAGGNDTSYTSTEVRLAVKEFMNAITIGLPNTKIVVIGTFAPLDPPPVGRVMVSDIMKDEALALKLPFIDLINGSTYNEDGVALINGMGNYITGVGNVNNPQPTGTASRFISSDGIHKSPAGHEYLGIRWANEIYRLLTG